MHFIPFTADTHHDIAQLQRLFYELDNEGKHLMQLLAVAYNPLELHVISRILQQSEMQQLQATTAQSIKHLLPSLEKRSLVAKSKHGWVINRLIANVVVKHTQHHHHFLTYLEAAEHCAPVRQSYHWQVNHFAKRRLVRDLLFLKQEQKALDLLKLSKNPQQLDWQLSPALCSLVFYPFVLEDVTALNERLQYQAFATLLSAHRHQGLNTEALLDALNQCCEAQPNAPLLHTLLAEHTLFSGQLAQAQAQLSYLPQKSAYSLQIEACIALFNADLAQSLSLFEQALNAKNKLQRRKTPYLDGIYGICYELALLAMCSQSSSADFTELESQLSLHQQGANKADFDTDVNLFFRCYINHLQGKESYRFKKSYLQFSKADPLNAHLLQLFALLGHTLSHNQAEPWLVEKESQLITFFKQLGWQLFADLLTNFDAFKHLFAPTEQWDIALHKLHALKQREVPQSTGSESRIVWQLVEGRFEYELHAKEQKKGATGWSKGRTISLTQLRYQSAKYPLGEQDKAICSHIKGNKGALYLDMSKALVAATGASNIVDENNKAVELVRREPRLTITEQGDLLCVAISHLPKHMGAAHTHSVSIVEHNATNTLEYRIFTPQHKKVVTIVGEDGITVPLHAKQKALMSLQSLASMIEVVSDVPHLDSQLHQQPANTRLIVNITPKAQGLSFECVVMPLGDEGPAMPAGSGGRHLSATIKGKRISTERDLAYEQRLLEQLDHHCPDFLAMHGHRLNQSDWQKALNTLEQLNTCVAEHSDSLPMTLRWPKGKAISLSKPLKSEHLQLNIGQNNEWFDITGSATLEDGKVLDLQKLLEAYAASGGRYITLENDHVLALSEQLRSQLDILQGGAEQGLYHPLAARLIRDHTTGMRMQTVPGWDQLQQKMHQANNLQTDIPLTLKANLREYQRQGFDWLMRLAHWSTGACLADDMGLGKTIQAIALLLARGEQGPALIIAPTSVCHNWQQELQRFAPSLKVQMYAQLQGGEQKQRAIESSSAFDCIVLSYQQLQRDVTLLEHQHWHTIVADEAQALKNPLAKRTRAAFALKADFKLAMTGTPIENNLVELWSIMRFASPGLLGSLKRFGKRFGKRFVAPIEQANDAPAKALKAKRTLKELINPFILRRLKRDVVKELPSRTEVNQVITLSDQEQHLYEAIRQNALAELNQLSLSNNPGEQRIQLLAQLTKLRQACCHPKLVMAHSEIPSSKLKALDARLRELTENGHKVLIFSQFVGHLQLIRDHLQHKGISYQYLDGATPSQARAQRIEAFQQGHSQVFLISLKAGGFGLNLTAADYVIHMDPWWNPATEAQASDRAHRIGQTRPVTIYRMIAKGTVEEKIVELHQHKRELADSLLSGHDLPQQLSVSEMLATLKAVF